MRLRIFLGKLLEKTRRNKVVEFNMFQSCEQNPALAMGQGNDEKALDNPYPSFTPLALIPSARWANPFSSSVDIYYFLNFRPIIVAHLTSLKFRCGRASAYVESLNIAVLYKDWELRLGAIHHKNPAILVVPKVNVHRNHALWSNPGLDYVDQVQAHLVFVWKLVSLNTHGCPVVRNTYNQRSAVGVEKSRKCFKY